MKVLDDIDYSILKVARDLFLKQGIRKTEMKDIAAHVQIGRSTLYRRFPNKEIISFYIAKDILRELGESVPLPETSESGSGTVSMTGYDRFAAFARAYAQTLAAKTAEIRFLDEFDQMFTDNYPEDDLSDIFHQDIREDSYGIHSLEEGVRDGSIRVADSPEYTMKLFIQSIMGIAQRILPREAHYIEEHGYGREFLFSMVELFLRGIQGKTGQE